METEQLWTLFQIDQQRIGALDTNMITIRGWTITLVSALVGFSLSQHHPSFTPRTAGAARRDHAGLITGSRVPST